MKKSLLLAMSLFLVICLASCGGEQAPEHTHNFTEWITTKNATCTENGEMVRYCSCGEKQTEVVVASGAHIEVVDAAVAPTCTEAGLTEGKHCSVCNEIIIAQNVVTKLEHTLDADGVCALCDQPIIPTEGIAYKKSEDGTYAMVVGYNGTASKIRIADTYEGLTVTHIDEFAFQDNKIIFSVVIPDSVTTIGVGAFSYCPNFTYVVISDSLTTIGYGAFGACVNLASIVIPASVTDIGYGSFFGCNNLVYIEVDKDNKNYKSVNGHLYTKDGKTLMQYAGGSPDTDFVIPDGVTTIPEGAFACCTKVSSVVIPNGVTYIGFQAFNECYNLTSVVIPESVISIENSAFDRCSNLQYNEYDNCNYLGSKDKPYLVLVEVATKDLSSYTIHEDTKIIFSSAFFSCTNLTSIVIPDSVTTIGDRTFYYCNSLTSIEVDENNKYYKSIDGNLYTKDGKTLVRYATGKTEKNFVIPDGVTTIGDSAFSDCSSLTSVVIPNSVTTIGDLAFYECSSLTSVVIPDSVTTIGDSAFRDCSSLTSVVIGDSVTSIGYSAFGGCTALTSIVIPDSVTTIGFSAFEDCSSLKFNEYENGKYLGTEDNPYFALIELTTKNLSSYTIHEDTKIIADEVFLYCSGLTFVVIPDSVTSIGKWAFQSCTNITSVIIGNSVTSIGSYAFYNCDSLTSVVIPDSVVYIGDGAFEDCTSLISVVIGDSVTTIDEYAFNGCSKLKDVYYTGSKEEWGAITISSYNSNLTNATKHYNYVPEE